MSRHGVVVDTNVLVVANDSGHETGRDCNLTCIKTLREVESRKSLLLDSGWAILKEYFAKTHGRGQPGVGSRFAERASQICTWIHITPDEDRGFVEFPDDGQLAKFDRSDRKFVAVAIASKQESVILNAADTDWIQFRHAFERNGVRVRELCCAYVKRKEQEKRKGLTP